MEDVVNAYAGKRVLLTGHTGFKGGWLALWLRELGASVTGFALPPDTTPSLFEAAQVEKAVRHVEGDLRDLPKLRRVLDETEPHFVFHLAAQALVRRSYEEPLDTIQSNILGTAHVLEALRLSKRPCAAVIVTSDKCYENRGWVYGYREDDAMGGHDIYSMSKGAAELVTSSYRRSFFQRDIFVASARAGNVIGGGDFSRDRIVPDIVQALVEQRPIPVRNPHAVRPWQHVLEPLSGYLALGAKLAGPQANDFASAWNFGPRLEDAQPVRKLVELAVDRWGSGEWEDKHDPSEPHEAAVLRLATEKAQAQLGWSPRWNLSRAIEKTLAWYRAYYTDKAAPCLEQIRDYAGQD